MNKTVLYLQTSEEVATVLGERIEDPTVEFIHALSGEDALKIMSEKDIMVALIDVFIPDMKLMDFIKESSRRFPQTMLNVCIDITDPTLIVNLTNIKQIKKLYRDARDFQNLADGVMSTLDEVCIDRDFNKRHTEYLQNEEAFDSHLEELKEAMINQKNSYQKLGNILKPFLETMIAIADEQAGENDGNEERSQFIRLIRLSSEKLLRIMTTGGKFDTEHFSEMLREELLKTLPKSGRIKLENISNSVFGNQEKDKLSEVFFSLWLLTLYQGYRMRTAHLNIDSYYMGDSSYRFEMTSKGELLDNCSDRITEYVDTVVRLYTEDFSYEALSENEIIYYLDFDLKKD